MSRFSGETERFNGTARADGVLFRKSVVLVKAAIRLRIGPKNLPGRDRSPSGPHRRHGAFGEIALPPELIRHWPAYGKPPVPAPRTSEVGTDLRAVRTADMALSEKSPYPRSSPGNAQPTIQPTIQWDGPCWRRLLPREPCCSLGPGLKRGPHQDLLHALASSCERIRHAIPGLSTESFWLSRTGRESLSGRESVGAGCSVSDSKFA